jgi:hypothetical protein
LTLHRKAYTMKKVVMGLIILFAAGTMSVSGQDDKTKVKSKPTSSATQKVHNAVSKHKKHNGHKMKKKKGDAKVVTKVKHD